MDIESEIKKHRDALKSAEIKKTSREQEISLKLKCNENLDDIVNELVETECEIKYRKEAIKELTGFKDIEFKFIYGEILSKNLNDIKHRCNSMKEKFKDKIRNKINKIKMTEDTLNSDYKNLGRRGGEMYDMAKRLYSEGKHADAKDAAIKALDLLTKAKEKSEKTDMNYSFIIEGYIRSCMTMIAHPTSEPWRPAPAPAPAGRGGSGWNNKTLSEPSKGPIKEKPNVKWNDIAGLEEVKKELKFAIEMPVKHKDLLERYKLKPWTGILLFGPPGCGKTLLSKAAASEIDASFITVNIDDIKAKYVGEAEKNIANVFESARENKPAIILFDEIDALARARGEADESWARGVLNILLTQLDGWDTMKNDGILVLAATNRPDDIDEALLQRFPLRIYIPLPDFECRKKIFDITLKGAPVANVNLDELAGKTDLYSGRELSQICTDVKNKAVRKTIENKKDVPIAMKHFEDTIAKRKPSISKEEVERFLKLKEKWSNA